MTLFKNAFSRWRMWPLQWLDWPLCMPDFTGTTPVKVMAVEIRYKD